MRYEAGLNVMVLDTLNEFCAISEDELIAAQHHQQVIACVFEESPDITFLGALLLNQDNQDIIGTTFAQIQPFMRLGPGNDFFQRLIIRFSAPNVLEPTTLLVARPYTTVQFDTDAITDYRVLGLLRHAARTPGSRYKSNYFGQINRSTRPGFFHLMILGFNVNSTENYEPDMSRRFVVMTPTVTVPELLRFLGLAENTDITPYAISDRQILADCAIFDYSAAQSMDSAEQLRKKGESRADAILSGLGLPADQTLAPAFSREEHIYYRSIWNLHPDLRKMSAYVYAQQTPDGVDPESLAFAYHTHMFDMIQFHGMASIKFATDVGSADSRFLLVLSSTKCLMEMQKFLTTKREVERQLVTFPTRFGRQFLSPDNWGVREIPLSLYRHGNFDLTTLQKSRFPRFFNVCSQIVANISGASMANFRGIQGLSAAEIDAIGKLVIQSNTALRDSAVPAISEFDYDETIWGMPYAEFKAATTASNKKEQDADDMILQLLLKRQNK